jgi:hypothetical protein
MVEAGRLERRIRVLERRLAQSLERLRSSSRDMRI